MESIETANRFGALAQGTRIEIMRHLAERAPMGMAAGELAAVLGQAPSTLSFHLAALEQAGLVQATRHGRHVIYAVRLAGLRVLMTFLAEICSQGRPELGRQIAGLLPDAPDNERGIQPAFNVLFLCTHNSARSIMAEAILDTIGKGRFHGYSAGSEPARKPLPAVVERLTSLGHDVARLRSKSWCEFTKPDAPRMDVVLTLCDVPEGEPYPTFGDRVVAAAWPFPDPVKFKGSESERLTTLNALYGMIRRRLEIFVNLPFASLDRRALKTRLDALGDITRYA